MKTCVRTVRMLVVFLGLIFLAGCGSPHPPALLPITADAAFVMIPLGTGGGLNEANLSSYLLAPAGSADFLALDAGTLFAGLQNAAQQGSFDMITPSADPPLSLEGTVLLQHIKAYAISHAHLDHVAGLVINSPDDSAKPILGLPETIDTIRDHLFNWKVWPNFGNEGEGFLLKKYQYVRLTPGQPYEIDHTVLTITPFELSHSGDYRSTAFLIAADGSYVLYFGDTGPDAVENSQFLGDIWRTIAPLVKAGQLRGILLEASYPDGRPDNQLFGHLTPTWVVTELRRLAELVNPEQPEQALQGLNVVVTHIKPEFSPETSPADTIMRELHDLNDLGVTFILPESGKRIVF